MLTVSTADLHPESHCSKDYPQLNLKRCELLLCLLLSCLLVEVSTCLDQLFLPLTALVKDRRMRTDSDTSGEVEERPASLPSAERHRDDRDDRSLYDRGDRPDRDLRGRDEFYERPERDG